MTARLARWFRQVFARESARRVPRRLHLTPLEDRTVPSFGAFGEEFIVNNDVSGTQARPKVAVAANGNAVVTWVGVNPDGDSGLGIYAQRYDSVGKPQGANFRVPTNTAGSQTRTAVASDADGDFVIVWQSDGGQDGDGLGVFAQRYDAGGVAQGGEFQVNTFTAGLQARPAVAMDAAGNFVIAWNSDGQDGDGTGIYAQRYSAAGAALGGEFGVNSSPFGDQTAPAVATNANGDFMIAWTSDGQEVGLGVYAQRYNAAGGKLDGEFSVNFEVVGDQTEVSIASDASGNIVAAWSSIDQNGRSDVYTRRFDEEGVGQFGEFRVNTNTAGNQALASVASDADGNFAIAWHDDSGLDGEGLGVFGQRYLASGAKLGGEFRINTFTAGDSAEPSMASDAKGNLLVAYTSFDGSGGGVLAQQYRVDFPILGNPGDRTVNELATVAFNVAPAGESYTYSIVGGFLPGMTLDATTGAFRWTPTEAQDGHHVVRFRATGAFGALGTAERDVAITVNEVNVAPVLRVTTKTLASVAEDATTNAGVLVSSIAGTSTVTDPDDATAYGIAITAAPTVGGRWQYALNGTTWADVGNRTASSARLLAADATTRVRFVPSTNFVGNVSFTFRAWDGTAGTNGGAGNTTANGGATAFSTATANATLAVTAVNDAPVNTIEDATIGTFRNGSAAFTGTQEIRVADIDAGTRTMRVTLSAPRGTFTIPAGSGVTVTGRDTATLILGGSAAALNNALKRVTYRSAFGFAGTTGITVKTDDLGNVGSGGSKSDTDTITLTVTNRAPTPRSPLTGLTTYNAPRNTTFLVTSVSSGVLRAFTDVDGDPLTASVVTPPPSSKGTLILDANGRFAFAPKPNVTGAVTFTVRVSDGVAFSTAITFTIVIA